MLDMCDIYNRICQSKICDKVLVRKTRPGATPEPMTTFRARKYCGPVCRSNGEFKSPARGYKERPKTEHEIYQLEWLDRFLSKPVVS